MIRWRKWPPGTIGELNGQDIYTITWQVRADGPLTSKGYRRRHVFFRLHRIGWSTAKDFKTAKEARKYAEEHE